MKSAVGEECSTDVLEKAGFVDEIPSEIGDVMERRATVLEN